MKEFFEEMFGDFKKDKKLIFEAIFWALGIVGLIYGLSIIKYIYFL